MAKRKNYEQSCKHLMNLGWIEEVPPIPDRMPKQDDEELGLSFFRTILEDEDQEEPFINLTIPRTYINRTKADVISFDGTDLSESAICWNEFEDVDFCESKLRDSDMRANQFLACVFDDADLRGCDLRHSEFNRCTFDGAKMKGTIMTRDQAEMMELDDKQTSVIDWRDDAGPEPEGG